ncbi:unnamed protein product [Rotaria socialis]|uniref:tRNA-5-taurinomethyluridine 2-sulfurtransferase n=1 Tax=Rotaria socialis TaxID=392032 RepID=A0A818R148_9BILA|nr:unnamed protein product [Rotaria socialis]
MNLPIKKRIVCAMSGGVDSSVSAALLKRKGYEVIGCFMRNWEKHEDDDSPTKCTNDKDLDDAIYVSNRLDIRLHVVDFIKDYWTKVFEPFLNDYQTGLTPNPDILCNKYIKFDALLKYCQERLDTTCLATGHYAQIKKDEQGINSVLPFVEFPVGGMMKSDVKHLANEMNLEKIAQKHESMGLCFVGKRKFSRFISQFIPDNVGYIKLIETNEIIGKHHGLHCYTIGQRITPIDRYYKSSKPLYIARKDAIENIIYAAPGTNHPALFTKSFHTDIPHWINEIPSVLKETREYKCDFRFQHKHRPLSVVISLSNNNTLNVSLPIPIRSICPGQYAVFYDGDEVLGAARIIDSGISLYDLKWREPLINSDLFLNLC